MEKDKIISKEVAYKDLPENLRPDKVMLSTGELVTPNDNTMIRVDENGIPLDYNKLKDNYVSINENGELQAVKPLSEVVITKNKPIPLTQWVNDNILLNKDNIRVNNYIENWKTPSGKETLSYFTDMSNKVGLGTAAAILGPEFIFNPVLKYPIETIASTLGSEAVNKLTEATTGKSWGKYIHDETGLPEGVAMFLNPGQWYGISKGNIISNKNLISKFFKGDVDLNWNALNKSHWLFNSKPDFSKIALSTANRIIPFTTREQLLPFKAIAYQIAKRTKGNATVRLKDIIKNPASYNGSVAGDKNLLAYSIFHNTGVRNTPWFTNLSKRFKSPDYEDLFPQSDKYEKLYPGIHSRTIEMTPYADVQSLDFNSLDEFLQYSKGKIGERIGKENGMVVKVGDNQFMYAPNTANSDKLGVLEDIAGHNIIIKPNSSGQLVQQSEDFWKFNPDAYNTKWNTTSKQPALMDKIVDEPFRLLSRPIPITINGKPLFLSDLPKYQKGGVLVSEFTPLTYNKLNYPSLIDRSQTNFPVRFIDPPLLINPVIDLESKIEDVIIDDSRFIYDVEPMLVESATETPSRFNKEYKGASSFNSFYDNVEERNPLAIRYREFLTKIARRESGFNNLAKNPGAPAYGYFQFMQDGSRYNNITRYANTSISNFLNNPELQIESAIKLAADFERSFTQRDIEKAHELGYGMESLLAGAWLAGPSGVKKFLHQGVNLDDKHWNDGKGVSVKDVMDAFA